MQREKLLTLQRESPLDVRQRIGAKALGWIEANLVGFDPRNSFTERSITAVAELAFMCVQLERWGYRDLRPRRTCLQLLPRAVADPKMQQVLYDFRQAFPALLVFWLALEGSKSPGIERDRIQSLVDSGFGACERAPHRMLEVRYLLELGNFRHNLPSAEAMFCLTTLGLEVAHQDFNREEAYSVTHTVWYITDFGRRRPAILKSRLPRTIKLLEAMVAQAVATQDWDLTAESLLALDCLPSGPPVSVEYAWEKLAGAQTESGALPPVQDQLARGFEACYHPTLTAALAALGPVSIRAATHQ